MKADLINPLLLQSALPLTPQERRENYRENMLAVDQALREILKRKREREIDNDADSISR